MGTDISVLAKKIESENRLQTEGGGNTLATYASGIDAKFRICQMLQQSQVLPKALSSPQAILAVVLMGQEYGFAPIVSCHLFDFIQGRASMRAAGMQALCVRNGGSFHVIEESATACKIKAFRPDRNWEQTFEFTIEMARRMGLAEKDNWKKHPEAMLYARCTSLLARRGWPDLIGGLQASEEMQDAAIVEEAPAESTAAVFASAEAQGAATVKAIEAEFTGSVDDNGEVVEEKPKAKLSDLNQSATKAKTRLEQLKKEMDDVTI